MTQIDPPSSSTTTTIDSVVDDLTPGVWLDGGVFVPDYPCDTTADCPNNYCDGNTRVYYECGRTESGNRKRCDAITQPCPEDTVCMESAPTGGVMAETDAGSRNELYCSEITTGIEVPDYLLAPDDEVTIGDSTSASCTFPCDVDNDGIEDDVDLCADGSFADDRLDGPPNEKGEYKDVDNDNIRDACDFCAGNPNVFSDNRLDDNKNTVADACEDEDHDLIPDPQDLCPDKKTFADNRKDDKDGDKIFDDVDNDGLRDACDLCPDELTFADNREDSDNDGISDNCEILQTFECPEGKICLSESTIMSFSNVWVGDVETGYRDYPPKTKWECETFSIGPTSKGVAITHTRYKYIDGDPVKYNDIWRKGNECTYYEMKVRTRYCPMSNYEPLITREDEADYKEREKDFSLYSDPIPCSNVGKGFVCKEERIDPVYVDGKMTYSGYTTAYCAAP